MPLLSGGDSKLDGYFLIKLGAVRADGRWASARWGASDQIL